MSRAASNNSNGWPVDSEMTSPVSGPNDSPMSYDSPMPKI